MREGVCCSCQSIHPVRPSRVDPETSDLCEGFDELEDAERFVMDIHDVFGSHCDGSGTMPQALIANASAG